jgi:uncharacterized damage-inducible protein DinB
MRRIEKPKEAEYAPYAIQYIGLLPDDGLALDHLQKNFEATRAFLLSLPEDKLLYRYAPDKWTIKEIVSHIADDERIYTYRALRFARNDRTELPGFDQDEYARYSGANQRTLDNLLDEFATVRAATLSFFNGIGDGALTRAGVASGNVMSVRAIAYHIAGHELRHMNIIRERYL